MDSAAQPTRRWRASVRLYFRFSDQGFPRNVAVEFVDYAIGNWECKCGNLKGLHHLAPLAVIAALRWSPIRIETGDVICHKCGTFNKNTPTFCRQVRRSGSDAVGKYYVMNARTRYDLFRAAVSYHSSHYLRQGPDTGAQVYLRTSRNRSFLRRYSVDDRERDLHHQLAPSASSSASCTALRASFLKAPIIAPISSEDYCADPRLVGGDSNTTRRTFCTCASDRKRKFLGSIFLRALGMKSNEDILRTFYQVERISLRDKEMFWNVSPGIVDSQAHLRNSQS